MKGAIDSDLLEVIPLFAGFNETERRQIADVATIAEFAAGQVIIKQSERCQNLWVVLDGRCEVVRQQSGARTGGVVLAAIELYSHFGEMSFFHGAPHSASVIARTPLRLLRIARGDYQDLIDDGIAAAYKLAYNVVESLADRLRRMDQWVAELVAATPSAVQADVPEWMKFREKLFGGWTL